MFTGIIEAIGRVETVTAVGGDVRLRLAVGQLDMADVKLGDSIAVNGVCLTVVEFDQGHFTADVSNETLAHSSLKGLKRGSSVNLEKAMLANGRFGGHIVSGHVDGLGELIQISPNGRALDYWVRVPTELARYIAEKGSVTVDGVSLTVNQVKGDTFRLTIIPHTAEQTIIQQYQVGQSVNLEVDVLARYLERLLTAPSERDKAQAGLTIEALAQAGFVK